MLAPSSRSRSRTVETAPSNNSSTLLRSIPQFSPATNSLTSPSSLPDPQNPRTKQEMISTITRQSSSTPHESSAQSSNGVEPAQNDVQEDDGSSSLSDPVDDADDGTDIISPEQNPAADSDVDSETETERLERTPQKLNATSGGSLLPEKSPSKLAQEILLDGSAEDIDKANSILAGLSPSKGVQIDTSDLGDHDEESPSRKRKRSVSAVSSLSDTDEPLAKRSQSARYQPGVATSSTETLNNQTTDIGQEPEGAEQEGDDTVLAEEDQEVGSVEPTAPVRGRKGRKGKRKGKKAAHEADLEQAPEHIEEIPEEEKDAADAFAEEDEEGARDEEVAKKKLAIDALSKIEKEFAAFREKHINQQLRLITQELDLLKQPSSTHPEYLAQLRCVDDYRDKKIKYEDTVFRLRMESNQVRTIAERQQHHSQYFQEVRDLRDKALEDCYQNLYALQKDRRRWGADETNYVQLYNPKRAQQIAQQSSYNLEVSILAGVAKHVGFPAAPELPTLMADDVESDLKSMKIPDRPLQPRILLRDAERATDPSFFEQNAWANPPIPHPMLNPQTFATPNGQNRIVSNGSTIDMSMMSVPNSQHPTPQNNHVASEAGLGGEMAKPSPLGLAKLASTAEAVSASTAVSSVLEAAGVPTQVFPTSALHGSGNEVEAPTAAPPAAALSISVGGNGRFQP